MAAACAELWQYQKSGNWELKTDIKMPGTGKYWKFKLDYFEKSPTLSSALRSILDDNAGQLSLMAFPTARGGEKWSAIRSAAEEARSKNKEKDWVYSTKDYIDELVKPQIHTEYRAISPKDYTLNGENPLHSDAYAAMGSYGLRAYVRGEFQKKKNDPKIYFRPLRIGARVWDSYDFADDGWAQTIGKFLETTKLSQLLGRWKEAGSGESIYLNNADFVEYRTSFKPKYNNFLNAKRSNKPRLVCEDFSSVSDYRERVLDGQLQFPVLE
jgi:hypothetical protein